MLSPGSLISPAHQAADGGRQRADMYVWLSTLLLYLHTKTGVKTLSQDPHDSVSSSVVQRGFVRPDHKLPPRTTTNHLLEKNIAAKQLLSLGLHSRIQELSGDTCYPQLVIWSHTGVNGWSSSSDYSIYFPLNQNSWLLNCILNMHYLAQRIWSLKNSNTDQLHNTSIMIQEHWTFSPLCTFMWFLKFQMENNLSSV